MAELKTKLNDGSVGDFISSIEDPVRRADCLKITDLMQKLTGEPPRMWGDSMVGFGTYHYKYASGREGDWFLVGFSPRKQNLTLYLMSGFKQTESLLMKLGRYKTGKSCLYIKKLDDIDLDVLKEMILASIKSLKRYYP